MAWASIEETLRYTGITVTEEELEQAQIMIELFTEVTEDSSPNIGPKNSRYLKMAVAYQAAWITQHPDLFTHVDVGNMIQDGLQFNPANANAFLLAPMASRAIRRLSWKRTRTLRVRPRRNRYTGGASIHNSPLEDDRVEWYRE